MIEGRPISLENPPYSVKQTVPPCFHWDEGRALSGQLDFVSSLEREGEKKGGEADIGLEGLLTFADNRNV